MRDTHEEMPEIIGALENDGQYFGVILIEKNDQARKLRFGVSLAGYHALKRILQLRPFDSLPSLEHRYFYAGGVSKTEQDEVYKISIRVEQGKFGKSVDAKAPKDLVANLRWFYELKCFKDTAHLPEEA